jgi:hypothetical protein
MAKNNNAKIKIEDNNDYLQFDDHVLFTYINQWENHSIAKIQLAAQQARNDLKQFFDNQRQDFVDLLNQINKKIDTDLNADINLIKWTKQLNELRQDLSNISSNIYLEHDRNKSPIYLIKLFHQNNHQKNQIDKDKVTIKIFLNIRFFL